MSFISRIERARAETVKTGADAMLVSSSENLYYFCGFYAESGALLITKTRALLLVDKRYESDARSKAECEVMSVEGGLYNELNAAAAAEGIKTVLYDDKDFCVSDFCALRRRFLVDSLKGMGELDLSIRMKKEPAELNAVATAAAIADSAFEHILSVIRIGRTEQDIAGEIDAYIRTHGGYIAYPTCVLTGANSALYRARPTDREIAANDVITLDFGARYNGYCAALSRTVAVSQANDEVRAGYNAVVFAEMRAIEAARAGTNLRVIDFASRDVLSQYSPGGCYRHATGCGIGLGANELPRISQSSDAVLESMSAFTVAPALYFDWGGITVKDTVVSTEDGAVTVTRAPKELIIV